jgi:NitT/TauT family transport system substrate-binding protein
VILREKAAGKLALQEALEGKADLAASSETAIMYAVASGAPVVVVATIAASDVDFAVVGRKDHGVTAVEDLKHKKIGLVKGTAAHYYLDRLLIDSGIHERDVTVVGVEAPQIVAALIAENVDAIVTWNPHLDEARKKLGANAMLLAKDGLVKSLWAISGHRDYLQRRPDRVKAVLKALVRAEAELLRQPAKARQIVAHNVGMDLPALQSVWRNYHFEVALDQSFIIALEEVARWAIRKRHVSAERVPNFLHSIDTSFLEAVRPETVQIIR